MRESQAIKVANLLKKSYPGWVSSSTIRKQVWGTSDRRASDLKSLKLAEIREWSFVNKEWKTVKIAEYRATELWLAVTNEDISIMVSVHNKPKIKKTKEESIVKTECKNITEGHQCPPVKEYTPPIKPTTFWWKIVYMYDVRMSL